MRQNKTPVGQRKRWQSTPPTADDICHSFDRPAGVDAPAAGPGDRCDRAGFATVNADGVLRIDLHEARAAAAIGQIHDFRERVLRPAQGCMPAIIDVTKRIIDAIDAWNATTGLVAKLDAMNHVAPKVTTALDATGKAAIVPSPILSGRYIRSPF